MGLPLGNETVATKNRLEHLKQGVLAIGFIRQQGAPAPGKEGFDWFPEPLAPLLGDLVSAPTRVDLIGAGEQSRQVGHPKNEFLQDVHAVVGNVFGGNKFDMLG